MFNPLNLISKFIKSSNQKELDRVAKIVTKINSLEDEFKNLDDFDFPKKTSSFKEQIKNGKNWMKFYLKLLHWLGRLLDELEMKDTLKFK